MMKVYFAIESKCQNAHLLKNYISRFDCWRPGIITSPKHHIGFKNESLDGRSY